jgi:hypothetical protein
VHIIGLLLSHRNAPLLTHTDISGIPPYSETSPDEPEASKKTRKSKQKQDQTISGREDKTEQGKTEKDRKTKEKQRQRQDNNTRQDKIS